MDTYPDPSGRRFEGSNHRRPPLSSDMQTPTYINHAYCIEVAIIYVGMYVCMLTYRRSSEGVESDYVPRCYSSMYP